MEDRGTLGRRVQAAADGITSQTLSLLLTSEQYGTFTFELLHADIQRVRQVCGDLKVASAGNIFDVPQLGSCEQTLIKFREALNSIASFVGTNSDATQQTSARHVAIHADVRRTAHEVLSTAIPWLAYVFGVERNLWSEREREAAEALTGFRARIHSTETDASQALTRVGMQEQEARKILENIRVTAATTGVAAYAETFDKDAKRHGELAAGWLAAAVVAAFLAAAGIVTFLETHEVPANAQTGLIVQYAIVRVFVIGLGAYVPLWCARNYRAESHLRVTNRHRVNALCTFATFVASTQDKNVRDAVLLEATRCVFAPGQSGYLAGESVLPTGRIIEVLNAAKGVTTGKD